MRNATVAIEDKSFYHEGGFNIRRHFRCGIQDLFHRSGGLQGASTITEQLVNSTAIGWASARLLVRLKSSFWQWSFARRPIRHRLLTPARTCGVENGEDRPDRAKAPLPK